MTRKKALSIGLIGAGGIGQYWSSVFKGFKRASLVSVVDNNALRAAEIARVHGGCVSGTETDLVCNDSSIDAVIIATPHAFLAPITAFALKKGKHVLSEKPGGITTKEVQGNVRIAEKQKKVFMIGFNHRYHPAYKKARQLLDRGTYGDILFIRARYGFRGRPGYEKEWRFNKRISGGGELLDQGMHMLDMVRLFLGDISEVKGYAENMYWGGGVEDNAFVLARSKKGAIAQIHVSWTEPEWVHSFEIVCEKGFIRIDGLDSRYGGPERITFGANDRRKGIFPPPKIISFTEEKKQDSFCRELEVFCDAIEGKVVDYPRGADAVAALKIVEHMYGNKK